MTRDQQRERTLNGALMCSLIHVAHVVLCVLVLVGIGGVTVGHIGHDEVLVVILFYVAIFVVIFCNWKCTLCRFSHLQWRRLFKELWGRPTTTADFGSSL